MRILAITSNADRPERALLCGLSALGHELQVLCERPADFLPTEISAAALKLKSRFDLSAMRFIRQTVRERKIQIVHSFSARALTNALNATMGLSVKHVAYRGTMGHLSRWDPSSHLSFLNPRVAAISCVSNAVGTYMRSVGVPQEKLFTIYKGHDIAWYDSAPPANRAEIGLPETATVALFVGNMRAVKGADVLINAFNRLHGQDRVHLMIIGEVRDDAVAKAMQQLNAPERVHALGYRSDATALMKLADFVVVPSRSREGFAKVAVEAMAQGIPVIVSDVGGLPELVEHQVSGLVIPPGDPAALASAMLLLHKSPHLRATYGAAARVRIAQKFTIAHTIQETAELYAKLIAKSRSD